MLLRLKRDIPLQECSRKNCAYAQPSRDLYVRNSGNRNLVLTYPSYFCERLIGSQPIFRRILSLPFLLFICQFYIYNYTLKVPNPLFCTISFVLFFTAQHNTTQLQSPKYQSNEGCATQVNIRKSGNKMPTRCNRGFYCRSHCLLDMFRAPLCPSTGAQEYYTVVAACGISCCGFHVAGLVWS